jgi:hypothetical protein
MAKKRNLNGLPNSLEQRYFSTLFYYHRAYMADWIWNAAHAKGISDIEIDILNDTVAPRQLQIKPIIAQLKELRETIQLTLMKQQFPPGFIAQAVFKISIDPTDRFRYFTCIPSVTDIEGKVYEGKKYTEQAMEDPFDVFEEPV